MPFVFEVADPLFDLALRQGLVSFPDDPILADVQPRSTTAAALLSAAAAATERDDGIDDAAQSRARYSRGIRSLHGLCCDEFDEYEMEQCSTWVETTEHALAVAAARCRRQQQQSQQQSSSFPACHAVYILALDASHDESEQQQRQQPAAGPARVAGGIVAEIYLESRVAMLSYVVTCPAFRGRGLGTRLVRFMAQHLAAICSAYAAAPLRALLVDVAQHRDAGVVPSPAAAAAGGDEHSMDETGGAVVDLTERDAAISRQTIWSRLGFSPVEGYDMRYPGYLGAARYNVGVYRKLCDRPGADSASLAISKATLLHFLELMFESVLRDEAALQRAAHHGTDDAVSAAAVTFHAEGDEDAALDDDEEAIASCLRELRSEFASMPEALQVADTFWR